jgi:hypothetical protein
MIMEDIKNVMQKAYTQNAQNTAKFLMQNFPEEAKEAKEWLLEQARTRVGWVTCNAPVYDDKMSRRTDIPRTIWPEDFFASVEGQPL